MKLIQPLLIALFSIFILNCGANKIIYPTQMEYRSSPDLVLQEFIVYIQAQGYKVLNPNDTRMTMRNQNGFYTAEYLETDWLSSGIYDEATGNEFIIKQKIWILLDSNQISVKSVFGYLNGEEMVVFDSAPLDLYNTVNALPEGLKNLLYSKAL